MDQQLRWGDAAFGVEISWSDDVAPWLSAVSAAGVDLRMAPGLPLVEILTAGDGHTPSSDRLVHTEVGRRMRFAGSETRAPDELIVHLRDERSGIGADVIWQRRGPAIRARVVVRNASDRPLVLRSVPTFSSALGGHPDSWTLHHADSDWLAENRWRSTPISGAAFPDLAEELTGHDPRGELSVVSTGTWSTGKHMPLGLATSAAGAWVWEIEHNGPWRYEIGRDSATPYLALSGPTHQDAGWLVRLTPGASFESVPVMFAVASGFDAAVAALTVARRAMRRPHPDTEAMPVVFNDYMNTLNGDPTTDKLLPLVDAAAAVGAEVFCIDAGWYDDGGDWWNSVGEWRPSRTRFPNGLAEVIDRIRSHGMVPGLWLEPEVVGVESPISLRLPDEAFLSLAGERLVEHERFHLDLRSPAARAHLDEVVARLVGDLGVGYLKLDYNIDPHTGSDRDTDSTGDALLRHNRAHLAWLDDVLDRHPQLILENCGSGGMRSDAALLSRVQLQSTSDQQDFLKYPPIAASAPIAMLPEVAASWAYPQPGMDEEQFAFSLTTGLLGRFFLSGHLNRASQEQLEMVRDAVSLAKELRDRIRRGVPFWPLGLPGWDDPWVALGLDCGDELLLSIWCRDADAASVELTLPCDVEPDVATIFPRSADAWSVARDGESGALRVTNPTRSVGARILRLAPVGAPSITSPAAEWTRHTSLDSSHQGVIR